VHKPICFAFVIDYEEFICRGPIDTRAPRGLAPKVILNKLHLVRFGTGPVMIPSPNSAFLGSLPLLSERVNELS
jgi:hypothetical protein